MSNVKYNSRRGFTLIELLVVVAIIGLLSSIISVALSNSRTKAKDTRRITDMKQIKTGMDLYFAEGSGYPTTATWNASIGSPLTCNSETVMEQLPRDPVAPTYDYQYTPSGRTITNGCGSGVDTRGDYQMRFYMESQGAYYRMDDDGSFYDDNMTPISIDSLL